MMPNSTEPDRPPGGVLRPFRLADFDEQLWPIFGALVALAGCVAAIIASTSRFADPRTLDWTSAEVLLTGWGRLAVVGGLLVIALLAVLVLQQWMARRVLLCLVLAMLAHLGMGFSLNDRYLVTRPWPGSHRQAELPQPEEPIPVPSQHWQPEERSGVKEVFEQPVATEAPVEAGAGELEAADQKPAVRELPSLPPPEPAEPEKLDRPAPDRRELARAELPPSRRAEIAAGAEISRRLAAERLQANESIAEPEIAPAERETAAPLDARTIPAPVRGEVVAAPAAPSVETLETLDSLDGHALAGSPSIARRERGPTPKTDWLAAASTPRINPLRPTISEDEPEAPQPDRADPAAEPEPIAASSAAEPSRSLWGPSLAAAPGPSSLPSPAPNSSTRLPAMAAHRATPLESVPQAAGPSESPRLARARPAPRVAAETSAEEVAIPASAEARPVPELEASQAASLADAGPSASPGEHGPDLPWISPRSEPAGGPGVAIDAPLGHGGLSHLPLPDIGVPQRQARPESAVASYSVPRPFVPPRSSSPIALDARIDEKPAEAFRQRSPAQRPELAARFGGSTKTEDAVELGLEFLARNQYSDGHWSINRLPADHDPAHAAGATGLMQADTAATGLALLAFLGAGYTHDGDKYAPVVRGGLDWLVTHQQPDGRLSSDAADGATYTRAYGHGMATIALCEAYGMTRDRRLIEPARRALEFILSAQHPELGGWRYVPGQESDTSVSGWQLMALKSAQMAGFRIPLDVLSRVSHWLDLAQVDGGARYVYNPHALNNEVQRAGLAPNNAMTAEGLLMRLYLGWPSDHPALIRGADYLKQHLPEWGTAADPARDAYYWYYATQVMFQVQGDYWEAWNNQLRPLLLSSQVTQGPLLGSWDPDRPIRDRWAHAGGRLYVTAMNLLMLEVYYRHLPLFRTLRQ